MKKLKAKNFIPVPTNEAYEVSLQLIAETRAENHFLFRRVWFLEQKIKESVENEINVMSYEKIIKILMKKCYENYELFHQLETEITLISGYRKKEIKRFFKLSQEMILKDKRSNDFFQIPNQPYPFPNKLNYK
ncbi:hypothetical protein N9T42_04270 [SAR86 cluster bacterium]|nr:hypothetical protein [SAR86 cluster bacterium]